MTTKKQTRKPRKVTVKAWAAVYDDGTLCNTYGTREFAQMSVNMRKFHGHAAVAVPCTVTYTIPKKGGKP